MMCRDTWNFLFLQLPSPYGPVQGGIRPSNRVSHPSAMQRYPSGAMSRGPASMAPNDAYGQHQYNSISGTPAPGMAPPNIAVLPQRPMMHQQPHQQHSANMYGPQHVSQASNVYQQQQRFAANDIRGQHYQGIVPASTSGPVNAGYGQMTTGPAPMQNNYGQHVNGALPNYQVRRSFFDVWRSLSSSHSWVSQAV